MSEQTFELKGNLFTLSVLKLISADLAKIQIELENKIAQAPNFFVGAPIVINLINIQNKKMSRNDRNCEIKLLKSTKNQVPRNDRNHDIKFYVTVSAIS